MYYIQSIKLNTQSIKVTLDAIKHRLIEHSFNNSISYMTSY